MKDETIITIYSITIIAILGGINAIHFGVNGTIFGLIIATIAGLAGYEIRTLRTEKTDKTYKK